MGQTDLLSLLYGHKLPITDLNCSYIRRERCCWNFSVVCEMVSMFSGESYDTTFESGPKQIRQTLSALLVDDQWHV